MAVRGATGEARIRLRQAQCAPRHPPSVGEWASAVGSRAGGGKRTPTGAASGKRCIRKRVRNGSAAAPSGGSPCPRGHRLALKTSARGVTDLPGIWQRATTSGLRFGPILACSPRAGEGAPPRPVPGGAVPRLARRARGLGREAFVCVRPPARCPQRDERRAPPALDRTTLANDVDLGQATPMSSIQDTEQMQRVRVVFFTGGFPNWATSMQHPLVWSKGRSVVSMSEVRRRAKGVSPKGHLDA